MRQDQKDDILRMVLGVVVAIVLLGCCCRVAYEIGKSEAAWEDRRR